MVYRNYIKHQSEESALLYRFIDIVIISALLLIICYGYLGGYSLIYELILCFVVILYFINAEILGAYRTYRFSSLRQTLWSIIASWYISVGITLGVAFFLKLSSAYSRVVLGTWFVSVPAVLMLWRWGAIKLPRLFCSTDSYKDKSIIIGVTPAGMLLAKALNEDEHTGEILTGFYDDRSVDQIGFDKFPAPLNGSIDDALSLAKNRSVKNVYIALSMKDTCQIKQITSALGDSNAHVYIVPDFFTFDLMQSRWKNVGKVVTLSVHDTPFSGVSSMVKRLEDIFLSTIIIALISPVLAAVAIGVKLSSPGPVVFKQSRYGLDGNPIKVWKFRSMRTMDNGEKVKQATRNDPRITPFGAFIRRTSLDELPQFFNVLSGRMSIVGPRPHAVAHNEEYRQLIDNYMLRHHVKPGITGWAQVNGYRGETDTLEKMEKRIEYDLYYIRNWSLWLDIKIVFLTIFKGFVGKTAY